MPLTCSQRCTLQIRYYILISNEIAKNYEKKTILLNRQQSKLFTSIAQMYRNVMIIYTGDILNLQSDMNFFQATNSVFCGKYVRKAELFKSGSGNEVETIGER